MAVGDHAGAKKIFKISFNLMAILGLTLSVLLFLFSRQFSVLVNEPLARLSIALIAPAIVLVSVMAAIRGYFQGLQNMIPTAVSQIAEQVGKIIFG